MGYSRFVIFSDLILLMLGKIKAELPPRLNETPAVEVTNSSVPVSYMC